MAAGYVRGQAVALGLARGDVVAERTAPKERERACVRVKER